MPTLYVIATPLGNLGDLSARAAETLRSVPVVVAEDTRRTRGLLTHLDAHPRLMSFHAHSDERRVRDILSVMEEGRDVALVTDAGTPGVSDPGPEVVAAAHAAGYPVVAIPGPSAVVTALAASGLAADRHLFLGFVPRKGGERDRLLRAAATSEWTVVLFEAPGRLVALLEDLRVLAGGARRVAVARELTKLHEEVRLGTLDALHGYYAEHEPRGEITVVLEGGGLREEPAPETVDVAAFAQRLLGEGLSRKEVAKRLTADLAIARNDAYRLVMELP